MNQLYKVISCLVTLPLPFQFLFCQQPSPIGIIYNPRVNTFAISGVGGGNLYELTAEKSSTSGQVALDWNIALSDGFTKQKNQKKISTLTTVFKYNPFLQTNFNSGDSLELRKVAFVDNEFQMFLGFRLARITQMGIDENARFVRSFFIDGSMSPYQLNNSPYPQNTGFKNFNVNAGLNIGYLTNTDFGIVGFGISPQINYIGIYENTQSGTSFEELNKSILDLSKNILGGGFKIIIPLNDFCFFFETRKYFPMGNSNSISGLTDRVVFSFGGVATGTVFKTKIKEVKAE